MIFRSGDGGNTWAGVFYPNTHMSRFNIANITWTSNVWGWHFGPCGISVSPHDANYLIAACLNSLYISHNGGATWRAVHSDSLVRGTTGCGGIPSAGIASCRYCFDPHDYNVRYLATQGDFGFFRTKDGGRILESLGVVPCHPMDDLRLCHCHGPFGARANLDCRLQSA